MGVGAQLDPACSPREYPSQRGSSVLSPSLALVTAAQRSTLRILFYIVDRRERGKFAKRTGDLPKPEKARGPKSRAEKVGAAEEGGSVLW